MKQLVDVRYMPVERTAEYLARLAYRVGLSIEVTQPATTVKLLTASHAVTFHLHELTTPFTRSSSALNLTRALRAARCVRAIVRRLRKYEHGAQDQVIAALEVADRLIAMLEAAPPP